MYNCFSLRTTVPKMEILKREYKDFARRADLDGINRTVESRSQVERLLWVSILLLSLAFSLYFTISFSTGYLSTSPFVTSFNTHGMNEDGKGLVPFPDLLICTSSPWDIDKVGRRLAHKGKVGREGIWVLYR